MTQDEMKKMVAQEATKYIEENTIIGVGSGSTVNFFIEALKPISYKIKAALSSSEESTKRLRAIGIDVLDPNEVSHYSIYIDGADEVDSNLRMIKGGGAALTREKIVSAIADKFICIVDQSKIVPVLGKFPLPIEVIPMARSYVARSLVKLDGDPVYRKGVITDNGNIILDVHNLNITDPLALEQTINNIPGVVTVGLFAKRAADIVLVSSPDGVKTITPKA